MVTRGAGVGEGDSVFSLWPTGRRGRERRRGGRRHCTHSVQCFIFVIGYLITRAHTPRAASASRQVVRMSRKHMAYSRQVDGRGHQNALFVTLVGHAKEI